jgi:WD40 repeat protein/serine/threonine protein kinase
MLQSNRPEFSERPMAVKPDIDALFEQAILIDSPEAREKFVRDACGDDRRLLRELEHLLKSDGVADSFLQEPPANLAEVLNAGLASAFDAEAAVVMGRSGHSVFKQIGATINLPRVVLREAETEDPDPIQRLQSPELPVQQEDSRYQLQGEIARGGMGAIIKGRDTDLGRDLAIKVLLDSHKDKPEVIQRFVEEAQIGGQLQHPGIAPIYELGQFSDKRPFFAMKLVKGQTLSRLLADRDDADEERGKFIGIFEQVCQTMAYAHSRGVIHRDLKPANIMVGAFGEVQVMDWGLAKVLQVGGVADEKKSMTQQQGQSVIQTLRSGVGSDFPAIGSSGSETQMGSVLGTPAYMPPEQALGEIDQMDERVDVFALGAILCEILTGRPPYVAADGARVFRMASRGKLDHAFACLDACGADEDLIALAKQCLELEPVDRPRHAGELAKRLAGYLQAVEKRLREAEMQRAAANARAEADVQTLKLEKQLSARLRKLSSGLAIAATLAILACSATWIARNRANELRQIATREAINAQQNAVEAIEAKSLADGRLIELTQATRALEQQADLLRQRIYVHGIARARDALASSDVTTARMVLDECPQSLRGWEWYRLDKEAGPPILEGLGSPRFTPDGNYLLTTASKDRHVLRFWDLDSGKIIRELRGHNRGVWNLALSPNGQRAASGDWDGIVKLWDLQSGREVWSIKAHTDKINGVAFSPDGNTVASVSRDKTLRTWNANTGAALLTVEPLGRGLRDVRYSSDGRFIAVGSETFHQKGGKATILDAQNGEVTLAVGGDNGNEANVAFSPDGRQLATASTDQIVRIWDSQTGAELRTFVGHTDQVRAIDFSPDGRLLATGSDDRTVRIWDSETGKILHVYQAVSDVYWLSFSPDGTKIAARSLLTGIHVWPVAHDPDGLTLRGHAGPAFAVAFSPDGKYVATNGSDQTVCLWDTGTGELVRRFRVGNGRFVAFSPDGKTILFGGSDNLLKLWDIAGEREVQSFEGHDGFVKSAVFSLDGKWIVSTGQDITVRVWDTETGDALNVMRIDQRQFDQFDTNLAVAVASDLKRIASVGDEHRVRVWNGETGVAERALEGRNKFRSVAFSPDGKLIVAGNLQGGIALWDATTGIQVRQFAIAHQGAVRAVAFSPDGKRLISGDAAGLMIVWDVASSERLLTLSDDASGIWDLAFSPDGKTIASAHNNGSIKLWETSIKVATERRRHRVRQRHTLGSSVRSAEELRHNHNDQSNHDDSATPSGQDDSLRRLGETSSQQRQAN